ncbi:hypothetical protein FRB90_001627 [Tulasnella sp. 427]|nr:hypothetical protein FRB90_001627 [Tulasnella sp. 427]
MPATGTIEVFDPVLVGRSEYYKRQNEIIQRVAALLRFEHSARDLPDEEFPFTNVPAFNKNSRVPSRTTVFEDSGVYVAHFIVELARGKQPLPPTVAITGFDMQALRSRMIAVIEDAKDAPAFSSPPIPLSTSRPRSLAENVQPLTRPKVSEGGPSSMFPTDRMKQPTTPLSPSQHFSVDASATDAQLLAALQESASQRPKAAILLGPDRSGILQGQDIINLLDPTVKINDEALNSFFGVLNRETTGKIKVLSTHLWPEVRSKNYARAQPLFWIDEKHQMHTLLVPLHFPEVGHWAFLEVDITNYIISYYDSLLERSANSLTHESQARGKIVCEVRPSYYDQG